MLKMLIYVLVGYVIFRLFRIIFRVFSTSPKQREGRSNVNEPKKGKSKIDKKDIIEAEFEEIKDKEKENSQN